MYADKEIETSRKYLQKVIEGLNEPIVLIGGWAVYFTVRERYQEMTGRDYLGSRDIDLGFQVNEEDMRNSAFSKALDILKGELGFKPMSFRLFKEIHLETGEELDTESAKATPLHNIFPMYVDMIVDKIPAGFDSHFGFIPPDEPLLQYPFDDPTKRKEIKEFGRVIWLPSPDVLIATKCKAYPDRDKEHKRVKDACDLAALLLLTKGYSKDTLISMIGLPGLQSFKSTLSSDDQIQASKILDIDVDLVKNAFAGIL